jgi:hypothetical protein
MLGSPILGRTTGELSSFGARYPGTHRYSIVGALGMTPNRVFKRTAANVTHFDHALPAAAG